MAKAKPFIKWVGGKGQLIEQLEALLPADFAEREDVTYIEPFVGGGAMLFYMLQTYPNIKSAIINDINPDLTLCYQIVRDNPTELVKSLNKIQSEYYNIKTEEDRKTFFLQQRDKYNTKSLNPIDNCTLFFFLNRTCFNGLYRVNKAGKFNVPFGKYERPNICDEELIMADHRILQKVDIYVGEYKNITKHLGKKYNFIYIDPPYRPLSGSACFIEYSHNVFDDTEQEKLKTYCDILTQKGCKIMQSNSNSLDDKKESYFAKLYNTYTVKQILAHRFINAHAGKREKETELLIMNY